MTSILAITVDIALDNVRINLGTDLLDCTTIEATEYTDYTEYTEYDATQVPDVLHSLEIEHDDDPFGQPDVLGATALEELCVEAVYTDTTDADNTLTRPLRTGAHVSGHLRSLDGETVYVLSGLQVYPLIAG